MRIRLEADRKPDAEFPCCGQAWRLLKSMPRFAQAGKQHKQRHDRHASEEGRAPGLAQKLRR